MARACALALVMACLSSVSAVARADTAGPAGPSGGADEECTVDDQCPDSGVLCSYEDPSCEAEAEDKGLRMRCEGNEGIVYCDPDESAGCAAGTPPRRPELHVAVAVFVAAAGATFARARRRRRP